MKSRTRLFLTCLSLFFFVACDDEPDTGARGSRNGDPVKVVTARVDMQALVDEIQALGTANANESVEIRSRVTSLVERVTFEEGQEVKAGQLLIELESSEIVAGLALAEAALSESRSLYNRNESLSDTQAISASSLEQFLASVKVNEALVVAAKARLANTRIRAPFSGRVGLRRVSPGSFVDSSTIITTLDDVTSMKLDFSVPEMFVTVVNDGMSILARSIVFPDRVFKGEISSVDTRLDPVSRAVQVRAIIPNTDGALKPGMFMTVDLQRDRGDVLVAPEQAIVPEGTTQYVFVVANNVVEKRAVILGRRIPGFVVIREGIVAGESVVTDGTGKVRQDSQVEVIGQTGGTESNADF